MTVTAAPAELSTPVRWTAYVLASLTSAFLLFGGAVAVQLRVGSSPFEMLFPVMMGVLVWIPTYLLDVRVRALVPWANS